jgi:hypothetical protein
MLYDEVLLPDQIIILHENDRISHKLVTQAIETVSKKTGIANQYGFITDPDNPDDQRFEDIFSQGYKIKNLSPGTFQSLISDPSNNNSNVDSTNENIDNPNSENLDNEKQKATEIPKPITGSGITPTVCHIPSGDVNGAFTITIFASSVDIHLDHGDTLGECTQ